jgi:uncharacterized protein YcbX
VKPGAVPAPAGSPATARITALRVYPVKGCRGIDLQNALLTERGFEWDRHWMFVDERGRFFTQRELPGLARIDAIVEGSVLRLEASGHPPLLCPVDEHGAEVRVTVWSDTCLARANRVDTRAWLRAVTGTPGQLVRAIPEHARVSNSTYTGPRRAEYFFADAFALLLANEASLAELNRRLEEPLPMGRFRPNIVVSGLEAFAEDRIDAFRAGAIELKCVKPCTRCIVTTTDQQSGERRGNEPLRTLRSFRWSPALKGVAFGVNAIVIAGAGLRLAVKADLTIVPRAAAQSSELWKVRGSAPSEA